MADDPNIEGSDAFTLEPDTETSTDDTDGDSAFFSESDSALGSEMSLLSSTASLRSSILKHMEENGRIYHGYKDGKYILPTDEPELQRQVTQLNRVLDVGCGLGFWAIDFAEQHPEAEVLGVDLSPIQPAYVPPNVQFEIDDLEEPWSFSFPFDYIHSLMMTGAFRDWPRFYHQAFENLNSGGWLEIQDMEFPLRCDDGSMPDDGPLKRWSDLMVEAGEKSGFSLTTCGQAADMMRDAGFVDIGRIPFKWPINQWPREPKWKEVGQCTEHNFHHGVETMMLALFTRFMGWTRDEVVEFSHVVKQEFHDFRKHAYFNLYITYGRKP